MMFVAGRNEGARGVVVDVGVVGVVNIHGFSGEISVYEGGDGWG